MSLPSISSTYTRDDLAFVTNLYLVADADLLSMFSGDDNTQEEFIALKNDSLQKMLLKRKFGLLIGQSSYLHIPKLQVQLFDFLLPFPST